MSEPSAEIKVSKNPEIQKRVEGEIDKIQQAFPQIGRRESNPLARSIVERELQTERLGERLKKEGELRGEAEKQLEIDPVTKGNNRNYYEREVLLRIDLMRRFGIGFAEVFMDLNGFKWINDNIGHHFGDSYLRDTQSLIRRHIRDVDFVARVGGDEFVVVLTGANEEGVLKFWKKLNREFVKPAIDVGVSAGVSFATPEMLSAPREHRGQTTAKEDVKIRDELYKEAERLMNSSKPKDSRTRPPNVSENMILFPAEKAT